MSGTTVHGAQYLAPGRRREPASYYVREGPLGQLFGALDGQAKRVAVIGLGAGGASVYGRAGERWTFYEIDEAVARIAETRDTSRSCATRRRTSASSSATGG